MPGILSLPGESSNWCGRAVTHTHIYSEVRAEKVEYLSGPGFTRSLFQKRRAAKLRRTLNFYSQPSTLNPQPAWDIRLIGHSNGCDVILDALTLNPQPSTLNIRELHLVCAACEGDLQKSGLNDLLLTDQVGRLFVYIAEKDFALRLARVVGSAFGYGTLGLHGPDNLRHEAAPDVSVIRWPDFGHADCWNENNFANTMQEFLRP